MAANNPNDDPNFERRLIIAFALSILLFLVVVPYLTRRNAPPPAPATAAHAPAPAPAPAPARHAALAKPGPLVPTTVQASVRRQIAVHTPVYDVTFSNQGAVARGWILTHYKNDLGQPLEVMDPAFGKEFGYPLSFWVADAALRQQLNRALYQVRQATAAGGARTLTFTWAANGIVATKQIRFGAGYVLDVTASLTRNGQPVPAVLAWPGAFGDYTTPGEFNTEALLQQSGSGVQTFLAKNINTGTVHRGLYRFAGVEDQYFTAVFLPQGSGPLTITSLKNDYQPQWVTPAGQVVHNPVVNTLGLAVSQGDTLRARMYVGPKEISLLNAVDPALSKTVDFGWFGFVAEPLFLWMNWTYVHWIHNYGWVIVFLTFVITMATFPLKMKAQKSQAKMLALQPKVNALNAKMKKYPMRDPRRQEVQQEIMSLYGEHGVNPLGGCLPMLITLPLVYAFWRVLANAIQLRQAPWIGYIHDLSVRDPYFVLPGLVVLSQFLLFSMMPTAPGQDPMQAKMMKWLMPVMMGWFFFYLPAGVNLYYLGSTLIGSGQQWVANRTYNAAAVAAVAATEASKSKKKAAEGKKVVEGKVVGGKPK